MVSDQKQNPPMGPDTPHIYTNQYLATEFSS